LYYDLFQLCVYRDWLQVRALSSAAAIVHQMLLKLMYAGGCYANSSQKKKWLLFSKVKEMSKLMTK